MHPSWQRGDLRWGVSVLHCVACFQGCAPISNRANYIFLFFTLDPPTQMMTHDDDCDPFWHLVIPL